jgi:hypothetical protein
MPAWPVKACLPLSPSTNIYPANNVHGVYYLCKNYS